MTFSNATRTGVLLMCGLLLAGCAAMGKKATLFDEDSEVTESADATPVTRNSGPLPMQIAPGAEAEAKQVSAQYQQGRAALNAGKDTEALTIFRSISTAHPNLSGPALNQALILVKQGKLQDAEKVLKKSSVSGTRNPRVLNQLGVVSRKLGRFDQAKQAYESAIRLAPQYDRAHYNLAILADLYLGDYPLAIAEFEKYQSLQSKRDKRVDGWLKDVRRRAKAP